MLNGFEGGANFDTLAFDVSEDPILVAAIKNISRFYGIGVLIAKFDRSSNSIRAVTVPCIR
jgi:hypothetical protein